jgi:hypothetical protein
MKRSNQQRNRRAKTKSFYRKFINTAHGTSYKTIVPNTGFRTFISGARGFNYKSKMSFPKGFMSKKFISNKKGMLVEGTFLPRMTKRSSSSRRRLSHRRRRSLFH